MSDTRGYMAFVGFNVGWIALGAPFAMADAFFGTDVALYDVVGGGVVGALLGLWISVKQGG